MRPTGRIGGISRVVSCAPVDSVMLWVVYECVERAFRALILSTGPTVTTSQPT